MIEIKDLSYTIGKKEILKNISFTVNKGSMTCIVGRTAVGNPLCSPHFPPPSFSKFHLLQRPCGRNHSAKRNTQKKWLSWYSRDLGWQAI